MNKDHVEIWNSCLSVIKDNVTEQGYKTWFEPIVPLSLTDNVLTLQVPTQFFYEYLEVHYIDLLKTVIKRFVGAKGKLEYRIPVVSTMMGIGAMPTKHPLYFGMVGNNGKPYANKAMAECDTLIMAGARVADRAVNQPDFLTDNKVLIHMDVDPAEIGKNCGPTIPIVGDAKAIFTDLNAADIKINSLSWIDTLNEYKKTLKDSRFPVSDYVDPKEFIETLSDKMKDDGVYVADVGQNQIWSCAYHVVKKGKFLTSGGMGTMGYSIPAALGAKLANPSKQVIAVCGDGSFQMSMCELATIKQENANVKIVVFKNGYLGMVREYQHYTYNDNYSVVELNDYPNLELLSKAYDFDYYKVTLDKELPLIDKFLESKNPGIMEVMINPKDVVKG